MNQDKKKVAVINGIQKGLISDSLSINDANEIMGIFNKVGREHIKPPAKKNIYTK